MLTVALLASLAAPQSYGIGSPTAVSPYLGGVFPDRAPGAGDTFVPTAAYPALRFRDPLVYTPEPNGNHVVVGERNGMIWRFLDDPNTTNQAPFLDLRDRVAQVWDGGFLGLAFHPDFGVPGAAHEGDLYVFYCWSSTGNYPTYFVNNGFFDAYLRLSKFTVQPGQTVADPSSEEIMMQMRLYNGSHRSGHIQFGPDGFLYVPIGDQFRYETAQDIQGNLEGGIHRIDVDMDPARSHAPRRTLPMQHSDEWSGVGYWIPNDNPFVDPSGATFEEYWSLGHRNPHRMTFDPVTGELWSGEVGGGQREEINVIVRGGNYGWPFREGTISGPRSEPSTYVGTLTEPAMDFARSETNAIIGGYVYRGSRHPELYGKYICAGYSQDRIFAIWRTRGVGSVQKEIIGSFSPGGAITFGQNHAGELFIGRQNGDTTLYELGATNPSPDPPQLLSQIGAFSNLAALTPAAGFVPYDLNAPFWSDDAAKSRWIAVPNDGTHNSASEQITFDRRGGNWDLPAGTVLMKHFELGLDESDPSVTRRLETRFIVFTDDDFYGVSYKWLPDGSDAVLQTERTEEVIAIATPEGPRDQTWTFPGRQDCRVCHSGVTGGALGLRTHQLNRDLLYPSGVVDNQLRTWAHLGMFANAPSESEIPLLPRGADHDDLLASRDVRARSYLDANCAHCHRADAGTRAVFDARFETPLYASELLDGIVADELGVSGARVVAAREMHRSIALLRAEALDGTAMPPIAKNLVDEPGVELLRDWIRNLDPSPPLNLGNGIQTHGSLDGWDSNMLVNESDTWTNTGATPVELRVEAFRFFAQSVGAPITPFVVRVLGDDDFVVVAVGTTRYSDEYRLGPNALPFTEGAIPRILLQPGETVATGFLDAAANGSGSGIGGGAVVPFCVCNDGDELWYTGGATGADAGSVTLGQAPGQGTNLLTNLVREYAYSVDFAVEYPNSAPVLASMADVTTTEGRYVEVQASATDAQNDIVAFSASGLPDALEIDPDTGTLSGWLAPDAQGTYSIDVVASDGRAQGVESFDLIVGASQHRYLYLSFMSSQDLPGGPRIRDEDIARLDLDTGAWTLHFDGSDVGVREDVRAFHILANGDFLFAFNQPVTIPGLTGGPEGELVQPQDLVKFRPTSLGSSTAGSWEFYFDGSDVFPAATGSTKIDAVGELPDGRLFFSCRGTTAIGGRIFRDEDLIAFTGTFGADTSGQGRKPFDGSDVGLGDLREDIDGACVDASGRLVYSVYVVSSPAPSLELGEGDLGVFEGSLTSNTTGTHFGYLNAALLGIDGNNVCAIHVE